MGVRLEAPLHAALPLVDFPRTQPRQDLIATNNDIKVIMAPYRNAWLLTVETIRLERHISNHPSAITTNPPKKSNIATAPPDKARDLA